MAPIQRLAPLGLKELYSFYLKSATDRWPLLVIYTLFERLFGPTLASGGPCLEYILCLEAFGDELMYVSWQVSLSGIMAPGLSLRCPTTT